MLSVIWRKIASVVREGINWVAESWAIRSFAKIARDAIGPLVDVIGKPVADFLAMIADALDGIIQVILDPIKKAWAFLGLAFAPFFDTVRVLVGGIVDGFRWVDRVAIPAVRSWIMARVADVRDVLRATIAGLRKWITDRVREIVAEAAAFGRWVRDNVLKPLWEGINGLRKWAIDRVREIVAEARAIVRWVRTEVLEPLWNRLNALIRLVATRVMQVVRLVEDALALLIALQRYGLAGFLGLVVPGRMGALFEHILRGASADGAALVGAVDDAADRWLRL